MLSGPIFQLRDLSYAVNGSRILQRINLDIPFQQTTVILGPSGAGKSSLLRLLNALDGPTSGQILYDDEDLLDINPLQLRKEVGMVFQTPAIFDASIRENLILAGRWNPHIHELAPGDLEGALHQVGLEHKAIDGAARDLSGGEKARLALARTLLNHPRVLLLDEPTAHLDPRKAKGILKLVSGLRSELDLTLIMVSHDLELMLEYADHVAVLVDGQILRSDPRDKISKLTHLELLELFGEEDAA